MARHFVGVIPDAAARSDLDAAVAGIRQHAGGPRWSPREAWHITLAFLGDVPDPVVPPLRRELATAAATVEPFRLRLAAAGTFPARRAPAVLWAGVAGDVAALERLARLTRHAAQQVEIPPDTTPYSPHLTLGRWRPGDMADRGIVEALAGYSGPEFAVDRMLLLRSHPGPKPWYETIEAWDLG